MPSTLIPFVLILPKWRALRIQAAVKTWQMSRATLWRDRRTKPPIFLNFILASYTHQFPPSLFPVECLLACSNRYRAVMPSTQGVYQKAKKTTITQKQVTYKRRLARSGMLSISRNRQIKWSNYEYS
ncbi:hypothetical protein F5Y07DRAFT_16279 [Xylaria sp. FL0933]|nr:hypothetical protein F5Y07DRAFT_16279 [Xylaria sp. FL0933]